jgi:hypothetical protein
MSDNDRAVVPLRLPLSPPVMGPGPVLVVADDRAAAAARRLLKEYVVVAASALTDMTTLTGRVVTILPDTGVVMVLPDTSVVTVPGEAGGAALFSVIVSVKAVRVRIIDVAALPQGFDLGNVTGDELRQLIQKAPGRVDDAELTRLSRLPDAAYQSERKPAAERMGVPAQELDRLRRRRQDELDAATEVAEAAGTILPPVPWSAPVNGAALLTDLVNLIGRFVALRPAECVAEALWIVGAHALPAFEYFPRLILTSPSEAAGKSTTLHILRHLVPRPFIWDDPTPASVYRALGQDERPTFLLDEMDALPDNHRLRRVINSGYWYKGHVSVTEGRRQKSYPTFAAMALALIGVPHGTNTSRAIMIRMRRRRFDESVEVFDERDAAVIAELGRIASQLTRFAADNLPALRAARPTLPVTDRSRFNWASLASIADLAGAEWSERCREAALVLEGFRDRDSKCDTLGTDLTELLAENPAPRFSSEETITWLLENGDGRWHEEGFTKFQLSRLLREAGCEVKDAKMKTTKSAKPKTVKTYSRETLLDFVARYGPRPAP